MNMKWRQTSITLDWAKMTDGLHMETSLAIHKYLEDKREHDRIIDALRDGKILPLSDENWIYLVREIKKGES